MKRRALLLLSLAAPALAGCIQVEQTTTLVGVVETIDPVAREVLIRGDGGSQQGALLTVVAGRAVERLNQIRSGDRVTVQYYQAVAAQLARPLAGNRPAFEGVTVARQAQRPGGEVTIVRSGRVTITAVDRATGTVSFIAPDGNPRTVVIENPQLRAFAWALLPGERVDVVYEEALAVSIQPMR